MSYTVEKRMMDDDLDQAQDLIREVFSALSSYEVTLHMLEELGFDFSDTLLGLNEQRVHLTTVRNNPDAWR